MQDYDRFVALATLTPEAAAAQRRAVFFAAPLFAVVVTSPGQALKASLARQTYPHFVLTDLSYRPAADYYLFLPGQARLAPDALFRLAAAAGGGRELLYADEDVLVNGRRRDPRFKPDFSPHTLLSHDYPGRGICVSRRLLLAAGGWPGPTPARRYAFTLRAAALAERIAHLPFMLFSLTPEQIRADCPRLLCPGTYPAWGPGR